ncbi:Flagellar hook-associated protein [Candidatus Koribacter versatilis Ellin345]|uniref:Flagellar hook-associated protein 1 n=1 Tax=Koribacter versatilis (strain Ellin345) TaxID=204669 RepID=Q1IMG9_KORVE|nr:flagellar hook-associated protein FlgK [Candidatus Koribacter versatilis]ABF41931.1 Flagellar hook-associated protein [Candidatus Koribacter versatilis Ellin345]
MASLSGTLSIATRAMLAEQGAMQATTNNIANVNTPGYSRQIPIFSAVDPVVSGSTTYGNGVELRGYQSLRNRVLNLRIAEEQQNQSALQSYVSSMDQVQVAFSDASGGIGGALSAFFNSISQLSTQPDSTTLRQSVLSSANTLVNAFHTDASSLSSMQQGLDLEVKDQVNEVNRLTVQIASLNGRISAMQKLHQDPGTLSDQLDQSVSELSNLLDVSVTQTEDGISLTTANGVALVVGDKSFGLTTAADPDTGLSRVQAGEIDLTALLQKGSLGGVLRVRDEEVPSIQSQLDKLAAGLSTAMNAVHQTGFDLNGNPGGLLFSAPPSDGKNAAALISLAISDPAQLAMSGNGAAGDNTVANELLQIKNQAVVGNATPIDAYSQIVFNVGSDISDAQAGLDTSTSLLQQLQDQRGALSGVSLDEETANLLQFQRGFEAAAHLVSVVDEMMQTVIAMGVTQ